MTTATAGHISLHLKELLEGIGAENLGQIVASMRARDHVPDSLALELANELADILSGPPLAGAEGLIYNRPTVGWYERKAQRIAQARSPRQAALDSPGIRPPNPAVEAMQSGAARGHLEPTHGGRAAPASSDTSQRSPATPGIAEAKS